VEKHPSLFIILLLSTLKNEKNPMNISIYNGYNNIARVRDGRAKSIIGSKKGSIIFGQRLISGLASGWRKGLILVGEQSLINCKCIFAASCKAVL
jgi:hypothetical protein